MPVKSLYSSVLMRGRTSQSQLTPTSPANGNKRRRTEDQLETPKAPLKNRKLTAGTDKQINHGLGSPIKLPLAKKTSPYAHLSKSIYVSRLQTKVTPAQIVNYIKNKIPTINEKDIALRLLVKKDQSLEDLTFISYRLSCTEENYEKFIDSSFWPAHVMIGEFIDRPREKQPRIADFVQIPPTIHQSEPEKEPKNAKKTEIVDEKMDTKELEVASLDDPKTQ